MHYSIAIVEGFFNITHIRNPGVAFGLFARHESEYKVLFFVVISDLFEWRNDFSTVSSTSSVNLSYL